MPVYSVFGCWVMADFPLTGSIGETSRMYIEYSKNHFYSTKRS